MSYFTGRKTNGFYIESGAFDGEQLSNTLFFELERNYTGITSTNYIRSKITI